MSCDDKFSVVLNSEISDDNGVIKIRTIFYNGSVVDPYETEVLRKDFNSGMWFTFSCSQDFESARVNHEKAAIEMSEMPIGEFFNFVHEVIDV